MDQKNGKEEGIMAKRPARRSRRSSGKSRLPQQAAALALGLLGLLYVTLFLLFPGQEEAPAEHTPAIPAQVTALPGWDAGQSLRLLQSDGSVAEVTLSDYLWSVVAAEMPASFQIEALKAQAICARTYSVYQRSAAGDKHPGADVCTDSTCCQAYVTRRQAESGWGREARRYADKITQAVSDTDGLFCLYNGRPIDAVFFSSAAGTTSDAASVWGGDVPYLKAVASPEGEEVPGWKTLVTMTAEEFAQAVRTLYPAADLSGEPGSWLGELTTGSDGAVTGLRVGDVTLTGREARNCFGLRSTHFTLEESEGQFRFWVTGYGHGVGMSQYGANALASEGKNFQDILCWYYTGVSIGGYDPAPAG